MTVSEEEPRGRVPSAWTRGPPRATGTRTRCAGSRRGRVSRSSPGSLRQPRPQDPGDYHLGSEYRHSRGGSAGQRRRPLSTRRTGCTRPEPRARLSGAAVVPASARPSIRRLRSLHRRECPYRVPGVRRALATAAGGPGRTDVRERPVGVPSVARPAGAGVARPERRALRHAVDGTGLDRLHSDEGGDRRRLVGKTSGADTALYRRRAPRACSAPERSSPTTSRRSPRSRYSRTAST